jgi:hypothetical protein
MVFASVNSASEEKTAQKENANSTAQTMECVILQVEPASATNISAEKLVKSKTVKITAVEMEYVTVEAVYVIKAGLVKTVQLKYARMTVVEKDIVTSEFVSVDLDLKDMIAILNLNLRSL